MDGTSMLQLFDEGGWVMWALLGFSVLTVTVALERFLVFRRARTDVAALVRTTRADLTRGLGTARALTACQEAGGVAAAVLAAGLHRVDRPPAALEKALEAAATSELRRLHRGLEILAATAVTAPLLGFLGTVTGMMSSFQALVEWGMTNPQMVALGIKEALTTTAAGLVVAVPAQLLASFFNGWLRRIEGDLEAVANALLDLRDQS